MKLLLRGIANLWPKSPGQTSYPRLGTFCVQCVRPRHWTSRLCDEKGKAALWRARV